MRRDAPSLFQIDSIQVNVHLSDWPRTGNHSTHRPRHTVAEKKHTQTERQRERQRQIERQRQRERERLGERERETGIERWSKGARDVEKE